MRTYFRRRKRLGQVLPPFIKESSDSPLVGEPQDENAFQFQGNGDPCAQTASAVTASNFCIATTSAFSAINSSKKHNYIHPGHDGPPSNNKDLNSPSNTQNDLHKESMIDSKIKLVEKAVKKSSKHALSAYEKSISHNPQRQSPAKTIQHQQDVTTPKNKFLPMKLSVQTDDVVAKGRSSKGPSMVLLKNKAKSILESDISIIEKSGSSRLNSSKCHLYPKALPKFDLYVVEEEEGSGSYGTVYRARRKSDGMKVAIKYPHPNGNKHHVENERKMLERFGGKNFVIQYEGFCRSENSDCFILKHVEYDQPDVLKKEIDISQLQWYGYCMFTALASLHKLGVVHRDVKPGNFLFSRKNRIGYLIDFNLAKDLLQKQKTGNSVNLQHKSFKHGSPIKLKKITDTKSPELAPGGSPKGFKSMESKMLRKKVLIASHRRPVASQGPDGSELTSAKDFSSTRTPSTGRLREPLPCQGRRELINLAHEAMQNPKQNVTGLPAYKRKRIAAPSAILGRKVGHYAPMRIPSSGIIVPGSCFLKERGGKVHKEGPCAGTKGFRAPEVLLRSPYQGPKLDVWSAGVTLLYLMIGKLPLSGEVEENMKGIVQLRGSEELWELAKLHNRESSFPRELYDARFLPSMELKDWCKANTRRPDFHKLIPTSLMDLVDKCLSLNPRSRISAEDALKHEFFAPCHSGNILI